MVLSIAFVGCGNIAAYHLDAVIKVGPDRCRITAVIDPSPEAAAKLAQDIEQKTAVKPAVFASLAAALLADPGGELFAACDVMVPNWEDEELGDLHEVVATEVLTARRHLLLEKPIAVTSAAGKRLLAAHQQLCPEKVFMVAENAQYWPEIVEAQRLIEAGAIGEVLSARARAWESAMGEWAGDYLPGSWRCDPARLPAAGFTFDSSTHWIRPLRMWLGELAKVVGVCGHTLPHMPGASMSHHVFKFASGKTAVFESILGPTAISDQPFFQVQGTKGEIVIDGFGGGARLYSVGGPKGDETVEKEFCKQGWDAGYELEYAAFVDMVLGAGGAWGGEGTQRSAELLAGSAGSAVLDLMVVEAMFSADEKEAWVDVGTLSSSGDRPGML